jgi:hypothetical protein
VRSGLAAARAQAALLDSLDLDSPAHRNNAKAEACRHYAEEVGEREGDDAKLRASSSVVESLDLHADLNAEAGAGSLGGLMRADQWLKRAINAALGANGQPLQPRRSPHRPPLQQLQQAVTHTHTHTAPHTHTHAQHNKPPAPPNNAQLGGKSTQARDGGVGLGLGLGLGGVGGSSACGRDMSYGDSRQGGEGAGKLLRGVVGAPGGRQPAAAAASVLRKSAELLKKHSADTRQLLQQYRAHPQHQHQQQQQQQQQQHQHARSMQAIDEQMSAADEEEARLMASLANLDRELGLAKAADPAAAYVAASEYREQQHLRVEEEEARRRQARAAPLAIKKLPPAPALQHWNRVEDLQQFNMQNAREQAAFGGGGELNWERRVESNWGTAQSGRRAGGIERVVRVTPALGAAARDRRTLLKNK